MAGCPHRQIGIQRQIHIRRLVPPEDPRAKNADLIQHHQRHGHQQHGEKGGVRRDDGGDDQGAARIACLRYFASICARDNSDTRQNREHQRQFERAAEYEQEI